MFECLPCTIDKEMQAYFTLFEFANPHKVDNSDIDKG